MPRKPPPAADAPRPYVTTDDGVRVHPDLVAHLRPIDAVRPDPANARLHSDRQLDDIARSFKRWGQQIPVLVRPDGTAVVGSGRLVVAAKRLGWSRVACLTWHGTDADAAAFAIAENRTHDLSTWDFGKLADTLKGLSGDVEFGDLGFTSEEASDLMADPVFGDTPDGAVPTRPGTVPPPPAIRVVCHSRAQKQEVLDRIVKALDGLDGIQIK